MLKDAIVRSIRLSRLVGLKIQGVEAKGSLRNKIAGALFSIALDHHVGIITLVEKRNFCSAAALLRPEIDSFLRGAWISYCAEDKDVERFAAGNNPPKIDVIIDRLQRHDAYSDKLLAGVKDQIWSAVCDYTHSGSRQVSRYLNADVIEPNVPEEDIVDLLSAADGWAMISAVAITDLVGRADLAADFLDYSRKHLVDVEKD